MAEHAPRSLHAGSAPQRHHHLCPDPLAGQYAREKQEILRDLRNYRAADAPTYAQPGSQEISGLPTASGQLPPPRPSRYL
jgi:hypothetical protein